MAFTGSYSHGDSEVWATGPLPHDASAREMEGALEALQGVGDVTVGVELLHGGDGGRVFSVMWPEGSGNVPTLRIDGSGLTPAAETTGDKSRQASVAYVNEVHLRACACGFVCVITLMA